MATQKMRERPAIISGEWEIDPLEFEQSLTTGDPAMTLL
jgi:hypothetical protein